METRPFTPDDVTAVQAFLDRIPKGESTFFKEDITADGIVERWAADTATRRTLAWDGDEVIGYTAVIPGVGWSSHVGEVRLVVDPDHRGRGIGRSLARQAVLDAVDMGLRKLVVEVISDQAPLIAMFRGLGFEPEALLTDHVRDRTGQTRDLIVLANSVDEQFAAFTAAGVADQLQ